MKFAIIRRAGPLPVGYADQTARRWYVERLATQAAGECHAA